MLNINALYFEQKMFPMAILFKDPQQPNLHQAVQFSPVRHGTFGKSELITGKRFHWRPYYYLVGGFWRDHTSSVGNVTSQKCNPIHPTNTVNEETITTKQGNYGGHPAFYVVSYRDMAVYHTKCSV